MRSTSQLRECYASLYRDAERLAGGLADLAQRATVYHHLFEHSGRNHIFPLIAAHGALWARGYFGFGMKLGWCCSWQYALSPSARSERLEQLADFANAFRDINRRVCIETYTSYHFTERYGDHPQASQFVPPTMLAVLNRCHAARRSESELSTHQKREMFKTFFLNEQETIVGPRIERATEEFDWPLMRTLSLRPLVRFAYFPSRRTFIFRNFANRDERIERGLSAFDIAAEVGWSRVEATLREYDVLPDAFFANSQRHFAAVRETVLAVA